MDKRYIITITVDTTQSREYIKKYAVSALEKLFNVVDLELEEIEGDLRIGGE